MKNWLLAQLLIILSASLMPAQPSIQWQKSLGGSQYDAAYCIQQTNDNGFIVAGITQSNDGNVSGNHGIVDIWVLKLSANGAIQWQRPLGGSSVDVGAIIQETTDSGYILAGFTLSNDGDVSGNNGESDFWVVKLTNSGDLQWQKALGGAKEDKARCVQQTIDGGYIIAGYSASNDGNVTENHGLNDFWIVKLNNIEDIKWQKSLGGTGDDEASTVRQTSDGGYIVAGKTHSNDGDVSGNHGNVDYWVVKLNSFGVIEWQKALGGSGADDGGIVYETNDGGYVVVGQTGSDDGQVSGVHGLGDWWVVKLNHTGDLQWQKALGGSNQEGPSSIQQTSDGGYIIAGTTFSIDGDVIGNDGGSEGWLVKLNETGDIIWQKTLGGTKSDGASSVYQTIDGGYIVAGSAESNDGDVSGNHGSSDFWIVKLSPSPTPTSTPSALPLEIFPNPAQQSISLKKPNLSAESTVSSEKFTVIITDLLGRKLSHQTIPAHEQIDISTLPNGMYILTATTLSGKVFSGKFRKLE